MRRTIVGVTTTSADPGSTGVRGGAGVEFVKGHGTQNDFLVVFDPDRSHDLDPDLVRRMCDRRAGVGADGILRVVSEPGDSWFMDYRNADGSVAEMCGNGIRVFARYLADNQLVDAARPLVVATRGGPKTVTFEADGEISVDMGTGATGTPVEIRTAGATWSATSVDMGNPHAVALVSDGVTAVGDRLMPAALAALDLSRAPEYDPVCFPYGVNVEFVSELGPHRLAMRVHERGVGETRSCGTGACAAHLAVRSGLEPDIAPTVIVVRGGRLEVWTDAAGHVHLKGDAVLTAAGTFFA
jgi:diaminopimelate epimerase